MDKSIKTGTPGAFRQLARLAWQLWGFVGHLEVCIWLLGTCRAHVQDLEPAFIPSGPGRRHWTNVVGNVLLLMQRPRGSGNTPLYPASEGSLRTGLLQFLYHVWATEDPFGCEKSWTGPGACSPHNSKCLGEHLVPLTIARFLECLFSVFSQSTYKWILWSCELCLQPFCCLHGMAGRNEIPYPPVSSAHRSELLWPFKYSR